MAGNNTLKKAKAGKNDEFYTQYSDIQAEMNAYITYNRDIFRDKVVLLPCDDPEWSNFTKYFAQNFDFLGLKKLISTSYAYAAKKEKYGIGYQFSLFEQENPVFDEEKSTNRGKIFTLEKDGLDKVDFNNLKWDYLDGDGDFCSEEVTKLRDEADVIITNPPFSLFRDFLAWIVKADKKFVIIGNQNAITYKEVFPLIKENKMWLGATANNRDMVFAVPKGTKVDPKDKAKAEKLGYIGDYTRLGNSCWFTNIEHGNRHEKMSLMSMEDNLLYNSKLINKLETAYNSKSYPKYDNYDAIEVPFTSAIPKDYEGIMGVPISFLDKYCPEQFEIINGIGRYACIEDDYTNPVGTYGTDINGEHTYFRILIRHIDL